MGSEAAKLHKLARLTRALNEETDQLNGRIKVFDRSLARMKLGVSVWLDRLIAEPGDVDTKKGYQIGYGKVKDKWRVAARRATEGDTGAVEATGDGPVPLYKAPRLVRVHAVGLFDDLLEALEDRIQSFLDYMRQAQLEAGEAGKVAEESAKADNKATDATDAPAEPKAKAEPTNAKPKEDAEPTTAKPNAKAPEGKPKAKATKAEPKAKAAKAKPTKARAKPTKAMPKAKAAKATPKARARKATAKKAAPKADSPAPATIK